MKDNVEIFAHDTSKTGIANHYVVHDIRNDKRFRGNNQLNGLFREIAQLALTQKNFVKRVSKNFVKSLTLH